MLSRGARIPEVTLIDATGAKVSLSSLIDRPLVLYFYPKDDTPGCSTKLAAFATNMKHS